MTKKLNKRGFTIVELVVVIVVIAVLAALLIPTFSGIIDRAKDSAAKQNASSAYKQYMVNHATDVGIPTKFIYVEDGRYVAIDNGAVGETVYTSEATAKAVLITDGTSSNYELKALGGGLYGLYLSSTLANFADPTINVSLSRTASETDGNLDFALYHGTLSLGSITVPQSAVASDSSVDVSFKSVNPADSIEMGERTKAYGYDIDVSNLAEGQSVDVTLNAPIALPDVTVYHNGEPIDAVYNEVEGMVNFQTDSFSPYVVAYEEYEVATLAELREAVAVDGAYIKLTADITAYMNKGVENNDCSESHSWYNKGYDDNPECRYYFLTLVTGVDVSVDLNGHTIEVIDQLEDGYLYCMGVFVVDKGSNINILDSAGNGKIKLNGPMFGVWAPYPANTSTDIYGGIFMSDSYVGDDYGWGYPHNNSIIYAGYDNSSVGSINIYGGYFLYNNFPDDDSNWNNGAFNVGDNASVPCIYVHDGVMLINQYWRQSTGTDDDSVFLADGCEVVEVDLDTPVVIDGVSYTTWYQVQTKAPEFQAILENTDTYMYRVGNSNAVKLGSLFKAVSPNSAINKNATIDVTIEALDASTNVQGAYTAQASSADWASSTIKFTGTGVVKVTVNGCELLLEVVDGKNVTAVSELDGGKNNVLLNDIQIKSGGSFGVGNKTLFGNGFTFDIHGGTHAGNTQGVITMAGGTLDNVRIVGDIYTTYVDTMSAEYYNSAVACVGGNNTILNSYISGCRTALRCATSSGSVYVENTVLHGGRLANALIVSGTLTLKDVTTISEKQTVDGTTYLGFGVLVHEDANQDVRVNVEGTLTQYNWVSKDDKSYLPGSAANYVDTAFGYTQFVYNYDGTDYVNLGIISISSKVLSEKLGVPTGYSAQNIGSNACVVSCDNSLDSTRLDDGIPTYAGWNAVAQGTVKPTFTWTYPGTYNSANNTIQITFDEGSSSTLDPNFLVAKKHGITLPLTVTMDGTDYTGKSITFTTGGEHTLTYTVTDAYNYDAKGTASSKSYTFTISINVIVTAANAKHADFTYTDGSTTKIVEIGGKKYVMPDVSATGDTIASVTVSGTTVYMPIVTAIYKDNSSDFNGYAPLFTAINITDYAGGTPTGATTTYNTSTKTLPSGWGKSSGSPYINGAASTTADPVTYSSYGLCYESLKGANISEHTQTVCFYYTDNAGETYYYYIQYKFEAHNKPSSCFTSDTLIALADGTQKRVDELTFDDKVLVWDFFNGAYAAKDISILVNHGADTYQVVYLTYSDGTVLKIIDEHGVFDYDLNRYVYLSADNAAEYIGHRFVKQGNDTYNVVTLVGAAVKTEYTQAWSVSSSEAYNVFAEGLLTVAPPDLFYNWMPMDGTLKYDAAQLAADVERYGLYTYDDFADYVTYEQYVAFNGAYLKIPVEKGIFTFEYVLELIETYAQWM